MRIRNKIFIILTAGILIFAGLFIHCGKEKASEHLHADEPRQHEGEAGEHVHPEGQEEHEHAEGEEGEHQHLHVKPEVIKQWGLQYTSPESKDYVEKITLTGVVKENQETTFIVNALVCGIVTEIKKDIGDAVKKGDLLCVLNSQELLTHKTEYIKAFQDYRLTKESYERAKNLSKIKAIEKKELISRETAYKTAMADYFSLEAKLGTIGFTKNDLQTVKEALIKDDSRTLTAFISPYYNILSPAPGKILVRDLSLGERVETNKAIFQVSDTRNVWALLDAMEKDLQYIEKSKEVTIVSDVYANEAFAGKVLTLMEKIDPHLRTVKVRVEVNNTNGLLKPEMYVRGRLEKKVKKKNLAIPTAALVKIAGIDGVFVIDSEGFLFRPVQVIEVDSTGYAFVNGLMEEDLVITEGSFYLKAEYEIQSGGAEAQSGHGHAH